MKRLSGFIIIIGILIALYPLADNIFSSYMEKKYLTLAEEKVENNNAETDKEIKDNYLNLNNVFKDENLTEEKTNNTPGASENKKSQEEAAKPEVKKDILGILKIKKINLTLPILDGATLLNMKYGAAKIKGTTAIGQIGNTGIAAHRSYTYGRNFNRLDEIEPGDEIQIVTANATYNYVVYEKLIVRPDDLSVLNRNNKDKILTLITCHPLRIATHRLIIHAIIK